MNMYEMKVFFDNGTTHIEVVNERIKNPLLNAHQMVGVKYQSIFSDHVGLLFNMEKVTHITFELIEPDEEEAAEAAEAEEEEKEEAAG